MSDRYAKERRKRKRAREVEHQRREEDSAKLLEYLSKKDTVKVPEFFSPVKKRARSLFKHKSYELPLAWLANQYHIRPVEDWRPKGKSNHKKFLSLINHLLVTYEVPNFLYNVFTLFDERQMRGFQYREDKDYAVPFQGAEHYPLFKTLASGGSIYKTKLLPEVMTKRMRRLFLQAPTNASVREAIFLAIVESYEGDRRIASLSQSDMPVNAFWVEVIHWLCRHMIDPTVIRPLCDFIEHKKRELSDQGREFKMKGRSPDRLLQEMEEWHTDLAKQNSVDGVFKPSYKYNNGRWEHGSGNNKTVWTIREILSFKELRAEGRAMRHCATSYRYRIERGACSLWSLSQYDTRVCTVEVNNKFNTVVQVRGKFNRRATQQEMGIVNRWAMENGLRVSKYL